jgi:hypothetical protein
MTLAQLESLTEDELALALYVVNVIAPPVVPKMTFEPRHLTWFKHQELINKLLNSFNRLKPEGHATYTSLMQKLGVCIQIKQHEVARTENTGSNQQAQTPSLPTDGQAVTGSNQAGV